MANSLPKVKLVIETSSKIILNFADRSNNALRIFADTKSLFDNNSSALYCATTDFKTSLPNEGKTRSSKSVPKVLYIRGTLSSSGRDKIRREMLTCVD